MFRRRTFDVFPQMNPKEIERIMKEPSPFGPPPLVGMADGRCFCDKCEARTKDIYRMVGSCYNCQAAPILMIFRAGDKVVPLNCPLCGCHREVRANRRAFESEIPAAVAAGIEP